MSLLSSASSRVAGLQALLSASTVGAGIATWAIAVECAATCAAISRLSVAARLVPLRLILAGGTVLHLGIAGASLLIGLPGVSAARLGSRNLLLRTLVAELRLVILLVELGFCEIGVAPVRAKIVDPVVDVIAADIRRVDVVALDVGGVDVVPVVVIVAIDEGVRIRDIDVAVVHHS